MEACLCAALLLVWCMLVRSEPSCDQTEFLHINGSCVLCPVCGPGLQLSEDCGFGDGGAGVCILCEEGTFSADTGVAPCMRCNQCNLLNRLKKTACSPTSDAQCGRCIPGYYELRSLTGEVELPCVPCYDHDTVHKECLPLTAHGPKAESAVTAAPGGNFKDPKEKRIKEETFSIVLIGSATASSIFLVALLLWAALLTAERFKQVPEFCSGPEGLDDLQYAPCPTERAAEQSDASSQTLVPAQDALRSLNSLSHENEVHPTSIVINVTTNIKPSSQREDSTREERQRSCMEETKIVRVELEQSLKSLIRLTNQSRLGFSGVEGVQTEHFRQQVNRGAAAQPMEQKLQTIWEVAQGQSIEMLDYDSVQDLSLLLDSADNRDVLRRLGRSLGVPPQVNAHLQGFQDLFQYLRTSTYTLLPQLAQAAALLPNPQVVARIHRAVTTKDVLP